MLNINIIFYTTKKVIDSYKENDYHKFTELAYQFIVIELTNFYEFMEYICNKCKIDINNTEELEKVSTKMVWARNQLQYQITDSEEDLNLFISFEKHHHNCYNEGIMNKNKKLELK